MIDSTAKVPRKRRASTPRWTTCHRDRFKATNARKARGRSRLTDARVELGWTLAEFARRSNANINSLCGLETGRTSPRHADGCAWSAVALRAADALGFTCEDLWPEHAPKVPRLPRPEAPARPDELYDAAEARAAIADAVARLTPVQAKVIAMRFGLDGGGGGEAEIAFSTVGESIGLSRERARQIETQAIAELAKMLKRAGLHV